MERLFTSSRYQFVFICLCADRLLDMLSTILSGKSYKPLGAPPTGLLRNEPTVTTLTMTRDHSVAEVRGNGVKAPTAARRSVTHPRRFRARQRPIVRSSSLWL